MPKIAELTSTVLELVAGELEVSRDSILSRSRELEIENSILRHEIDSLRALKAKVDSVDRPVPYPVEVTKEVAKPQTWWQKSLMWTGGLSLLIFVIMFMAFIKKRSQ